MFKKILVLMLVFCSTNVFASKTTIRASETPNNVIERWEMATKDDGYYQILGPQDNKKFIVYVSPIHDGKPSDPITISCDPGNGVYSTHEVSPGATIECYPNFKDIIPMYISPESFRNGSEGTFRYEPLPEKN